MFGSEKGQCIHTQTETHTAMLRRGFTNVFSEKSFARNEQFNIACKHLRITQDVQLIYSSLHWLSKKNGYSWASQSFLADEIGRSIRTVKNHISKLKTLGLIEVVRRGHGQTALYYPLPVNQLAEHIIEAYEECLNGDDDHYQPPEDDNQVKGKPRTIVKGKAHTSSRVISAPPLYSRLTTRVITPKSPMKNCENTQKDDATASLQIEDSFQALWTAWPIQQAKKQAYRAFKRLHKRGALPSVETLLGLIKGLQLHDKAWINGKVTFLHRWLRGERWNDEASTVKGSDTASSVEERRRDSQRQLKSKLEVELSNDDHSIMSQYMALSVAILTQQHKDFDRITTKVIEGVGGLQELFQHGMELLPSVDFTKQYKALQSV